MRSLIFLFVGVLFLSPFCSATTATPSTIEIYDLAGTISLTIDGTAITSNGGRVSNLTFGSESLSFDMAFPDEASTYAYSFTYYTELLESTGEVSDRIVFTIGVGQRYYHVAFGSDPDLPNIPTADYVTDLTTVLSQGLPHPLYEDGTLQKVGTINVARNDYFYVQSDVEPIPEPASLLLLGTGLGVVGLAAWRKRKA